MRQNNDPLQKGNQARPSDRPTTLAQQLAPVHPADIKRALQILVEFADAQMQDASYTSPTGDTRSEVEELALTLLVVWREPDVFDSVLQDYIRLLSMVRTFLIRQGGNTLAIGEIDRITNALSVDTDAAVIADPAPARRAAQWLKDKAAIAAAIALGLIVWDISSDGLMLWQIIAALGLVAVIGGAAFRLGQRLPIQTPVATALAAGDKDADRKVDHSR